MLQTIAITLLLMFQTSGATLIAPDALNAELLRLSANKGGGWVYATEQVFGNIPGPIVVGAIKCSSQQCNQADDFYTVSMTLVGDDDSLLPAFDTDEACADLAAPLCDDPDVNENAQQNSELRWSTPEVSACTFECQSFRVFILKIGE